MHLVYTLLIFSRFSRISKFSRCSRISRKWTFSKSPLVLRSCGPGKLTEKGKFPKVLKGGCKRSFGPREQRPPKSLLQHPNLILHRCKSSFGWGKRLFGDLCSLAPKDLLHPPLSTFGNFPFSVNFPGPQLPNPCPKDPFFRTREENPTDLASF